MLYFSKFCCDPFYVKEIFWKIACGRGCTLLSGFPTSYVSNVKILWILRVVVVIFMPSGLVN
jgi:hypothetical protein